ncbi:MAG TPA: DUF1415 family protein, partial [Pelomicrobium sp.]|nr:DUF1415 family protein [Pelomicrobium sp.]
MTSPEPRAQAAELDPERVVAATRRWIERAVVGLNLCPFARPVFAEDRIRFAV